MKKYMGNVLSSCSLVLSIIVMILYAVTISNTTSALGEVWFYILISLAIVMLIVSNFLDSFKETILIIGAGLFIASLGIFLNSQLSNIGYYTHGVYDIGDGILPTFVAGMVVGVITLIINMILVFIKPNNILGLIKHK